MRIGGSTSVAIAAIFVLGGCSEIWKSVETVNAVALGETFETATTPAGCRAAHESLSFQNGLRTADQQVDQSVINTDLDRCLDRVYALPVAPDPRAPIQGDGLPYCPPHASVLYGGAAYCVRL